MLDKANQKQISFFLHKVLTDKRLDKNFRLHLARKSGLAVETETEYDEVIAVDNKGSVVL